uniref:RING-type E3 ubiquitin transferase n=1 Tax=Fagus sylvatica TaxID=28930 RepID=A0A2N9HLW3_FAGSY
MSTNLTIRIHRELDFNRLLERSGHQGCNNSINVEITYTTKECIVIQLPDSIPTIESSIDALENINTMDSVENDAFEKVNTMDSVEKDAFKDTIEKNAFEDSIEKCIICLEEYEIGDLVYQMSCLHVYHEDCIARWLDDSQSCPVCRYSMPY